MFFGKNLMLGAIPLVRFILLANLLEMMLLSFKLLGNLLFFFRIVEVGSKPSVW